MAETLHLAAITVDSILTHRDCVAGKLDTSAELESAATWVRGRLLFYRHILSSLRLRSGSNKKRLQNEIDLAFNTVVQHDACISVEIGRPPRPMVRR